MCEGESDQRGIATAFFRHKTNNRLMDIGWFLGTGIALAWE
jgi:hypothetical protein